MGTDFSSLQAVVSINELNNEKVVGIEIEPGGGIQRMPIDLLPAKRDRFSNRE